MDFRKIHVDTSILVDRSRDEKLQVVFNLTFPRVPCYRKSTKQHQSPYSNSFIIVLNLDVTDVTGRVSHEFSHAITKIRLDPKGLVPIHDGKYNNELKNDVDRIVEQVAPDYCGSCYGGELPESGCCNTCEDVRKSYLDRGWAFGNPDLFSQVRIEALFLMRY